MPVLFRDREEAGSRLAESYGGPREKLMVLGIPRGGIPVGHRLAQGLGGGFDVIVARKLPVPHNPEAGFGAVAPDGSLFLNEEMVRHLRLSEDQVHAIASRVLVEVRRRVRTYRGDRPFPDLHGMNVVLTDDGLATGSTMIAALHAIRAKHPQKLICAVPVSPPDTLLKVEPLADEVVCLHAPEAFYAVGQFYMDFPQVSDAQVMELLAVS